MPLVRKQVGDVRGITLIVLHILGHSKFPFSDVKNLFAWTDGCVLVAAAEQKPATANTRGRGGTVFVLQRCEPLFRSQADFGDSRMGCHLQPGFSADAALQGAEAANAPQPVAHLLRDFQPGEAVAAPHAPPQT